MGRPHKSKQRATRQQVATPPWLAWIWPKQVLRVAQTLLRQRPRVMSHLLDCAATAGPSRCPPLACSLAVFLSPTRHTRRGMPPLGQLLWKTPNVALRDNTRQASRMVIESLSTASSESISLAVALKLLGPETTTRHGVGIRAIASDRSSRVSRVRKT